MIYYHGSDAIIKNPDVLHSANRLDFGKGFYITSVQVQAVRWAKRKVTFNSGKKGWINVYEMEDYSGFKTLDFGDDLKAWIDFVCACRDGSGIYQAYDLIKGNVADDKVFRVVDMYKRGIWESDRAIKEIRIYPLYDQIAIIHQRVIDSILHYKDSFEVLL